MLKKLHKTLPIKTSSERQNGSLFIFLLLFLLQFGLFSNIKASNLTEKDTITFVTAANSHKQPLKIVDAISPITNCSLTVDVTEDVDICNEELVQISAEAKSASRCPGGCVYPIERVARCTNSNNLSDIWLPNTGSQNPGFITSSSEFKTFDDGTATYNAIASNGDDSIEVSITFSGHTTSAPAGSPKLNDCETYDTSEWEYWTNTTGTIQTEKHGTFFVSRAGPSMQIGNGADVTRTGFGASGWLTVTGGDGFYTQGDVNIKLGPCDSFEPVTAVSYVWTTTDGTIVGNANQQTITVSASGSYTVAVSDCKSCIATNSVTVNIASTQAYSLQGGANFCIDGVADYLTNETISTSGTISGANNTFVVTDSEGLILALPATLDDVKEINFEESGSGTFFVYNVSYEDGLEGAVISEYIHDLEGCFSLSDPIEVKKFDPPTANAGSNVSICLGEEVVLTAAGGTSYLWSTGEVTSSITVAPQTTTTYSVTVTSAAGCQASDEVVVSITEKVVIGDFVWLDENKNGIQDDGNNGINDITVTLYSCSGAEIASTVTANNATGEPGAYSFKVCPNSGDYYIIFSNHSSELEFTTTNSGDDSLDSDANDSGRTQCFSVEDNDILTIDAGLIKTCVIEVDAGETTDICPGETLEISATITNDNVACSGSCVYPIKTQDRCYGPGGDFEIFLMSSGIFSTFKFTASQQKFERLSDGSLKYTATASNGIDVIEFDALLTGYTTVAPVNSPKENSCQQYDTSEWEYWTTWSGTISSRDHGVFNLSVKGASFQMGVGADVVRTGFGASGWFYLEGGDGYYTEGDLNVVLDDCVEEGVIFKWTTEDGNIIGDSRLKKIQVDQPGTYQVEVTNCKDCKAVDTVKVVRGSCGTGSKKAKVIMSSIYPIPVKSGGTLTIVFDKKNNANEEDELRAIPLSGFIKGEHQDEDLNVVLYNMLGQVIISPKTFKITNGKAKVFLKLDHIPEGEYILRAQSANWSDAKQIIID